MLFQEAQWIGKIICSLNKYESFPLLNIGSSTEIFRKYDQPYIDENIFSRAREMGLTVIHNDLKTGEGVDVVGDILDEQVFTELSKKKIKSILCSNLLEHVVNRNKICETMMSLLPVGGFIIVTVPFLYPRHDDPIDTMFRPDVKQIEELFPGTELIRGEIIYCGSYLIRRPNPVSFIVKTLARLFIPIYRPKHWWLAVKRIPWFFKEVAVTCVVMKKRAVSE